MFFWAALFVFSLLLQYASLATPKGVLAAAGDPNVATYDQCSNDDGDGYASGDVGCRWTNGNLQHNNSTYYEGDATVQRLVIDNLIPGSAHSITLKYGTTKSGKHAYDYLTTWDYSENWITDADLCDGIAGCTAWGPDDLLAIPTDPNPAFAAETPDVVQPAGRNFTMRNGDMTNATTPTVVSGSYAGDSETAITISFTVGNDPDACTSGGTPTCSVALWFGAHVSLTTEWASGGAATVAGSPYHVALDAVDAVAIGQRDNQMQSNAIVIVLPGDLRITKNITGTSTDFPGGQFDFSVDCGTVGTFATSVTIAAGGSSASSTITGISDGAICTVSETATPAPGTDYAWGTATISPNPVTIVSGQTVTATVANPRSFIAAPGLNIDKGVSLTNGSGYAPTLTTTVGTTVYYRIHVSNTGNVPLTGVTLTDSLFDLVSKGCTIPTTLAVGASFNCDYSDTAKVGTTTNTATADSEETASVNDMATVEVAAAPPPPPPALGSLTVTKALNPGTSFPGGTFTFNVSCAQQQTITLAAGQASGSVTINGLVAGTSCTVTEVTPLTNAGTGWQWVGQPQYAPGQTVSVPGTVTVTNFRGQVEGATSEPTSAPLPATDTIGDQPSSSSSQNLGLLLLVFSGLMLALGLWTPVPSEIRRRDRRG